ncbi:MAG: endo alpha-1,4 polygalactosaminidase [Leptospirillum sp.]
MECFRNQGRFTLAMFPAGLLTVVLFFWGAIPSFAFSGEILKPGQNYGIKLWTPMPSPKELSQFSLVILPYEEKPPRLKHTLLFGYFSVGEVVGNGEEATFAKKRKLVVGTNPDWKTGIVDVRNPLWQKFILYKAIPEYRRKGFSGIFLDTIDSPIILEKQHPKKYKGMKKALITLLRKIHKRYPDYPVIVNRALEILPEIAPDVSGELYEDFCRQYSFREKRYVYVKKWVRQRDNQFAVRALKINPHLVVLTLDYGSLSNLKAVRTCFKKSRSRGYHPYFSTHHTNNLNTLNLKY